MKKIMILVALLFCFVVPVMADQQGNLPVDFISQHRPDELRMISGGLCGDVPDDTGTTTYVDFRVYCTGANGVSSDLKGCAVKFYDSMYKEVADREVAPATYTVAPSNAVFWERYNCYTVQYSCSDFVSKSCGASGIYAKCDQDEMLRVRQCSNAPSSVETERCVPWYSCSVKHCSYSVDYGECVGGKKVVTTTNVDCAVSSRVEVCTVSCGSPGGDPGDSYCRQSDNEKMVCRSDGSWIASGKCESAGGSGGSTVCSSPEGQAGQSICKDGFTMTCLSSGEWHKEKVCSVASSLEALSAQAFYDPSKKGVVGRVEVVNNGEAMVDTFILEMQVRPEGMLPLAFVSDQKTCVDEFPDNVHVEFSLGAGEKEVLELFVSDSFLGEGEFDVYFLSRHKCFKDLSEDQIANYDDYQRVPPFPNSEMAGTVVVGDPDEPGPDFDVWGVVKIVGWVLIFAGIVLTLLGALPFGIPAFAVGLIAVLLQAWLG